VNIIKAIEERDAPRFLELLDAGVKAATKAASKESHALGLDVVDGRCGETSSSTKTIRTKSRDVSSAGVSGISQVKDRVGWWSPRRS
jgi:hypothetical protein